MPVLTGEQIRSLQLDKSGIHVTRSPTREVSDQEFTGAMQAARERPVAQGAES